LIVENDERKMEEGRKEASTYSPSLPGGTCNGSTI